MVSPIEPATGQWLHFSKYQIVDGGIRPAPGAKMISSHPWYRQPGEPPPYQTLVNLTRGITYPPDEQSTSQLLEWIAEHGVLGLLPHETVAVTLSPRWDSVPEYHEPGRDTSMLPSSITYYQVGGAFEQQQQPARAARIKPAVTVEEQAALYVDHTGHGALVDRATLDHLARAGQALPRAEVVRRPLAGGLMVEPLGIAWGRYFPTIPAKERATFPYPAPLSDRFWRYYVEPLDAFLTAADQLRRGLEELADAPHGYDQAGGQTLSRLLAPMSLDLAYGVHGLQEAWLGPSLLSMLAAMAVLDVARGGRIRVCYCKTLFISDDKRVEYCSPKCRRNSQMSAWRARKRQRDENQKPPRRRSPRRKRR